MALRSWLSFYVQIALASKARASRFWQNCNDGCIVLARQVSSGFARTALAFCSFFATLEINQNYFRQSSNFLIYVLKLEKL